MANDKNDLPEIAVEPLDDGPNSSNVLSGPQSTHGGAPGTRGPRSAKVEPEDPMIGVTLMGKFRIVKKVGEGGMGNVYLALQQPLQREVAIKLLKPTENNPEGEHYFMREVQAINMLRHPNIIGILDFGKEPDGTLYLIMEYLPGRTLKRLIRKEYPLDPVRICKICMQILSALEQAHSTGIVHCDLKPANVMLEEVAGESDFVKVLDFGIAKVKGPAMEVGPYTQAGNIVGTFDYMSPEQIMRKDLDGRADIWSLGVIMYEMLTRKRVFHDKDAVSIIGRVMQMPIKSPTEIVDPSLNYRIPPELEAIVLKAMERQIDKRYQSAKEMRDALKKLAARLEAGIDPDMTMPPGPNESSDVHSGSLPSQGFGSAFQRDASGNLQANSGLQDTSRTGINPLSSRSGGFGLMDSQKLGTGIAAGTSVLDQTFSIQELESSLAGERRKVAVLAIQQRARRGKGIDPEEIARRSQEEVKVIREVIQQHDGEIDSFLGGTYTVLFGATKARVGDNVRAVECALALRSRFQSLESGADHIGIGLSYGEIFLSSRKGGSAFGGAIDRAIEIARGTQNAQVIVDEELVDLTKEQVEYQGRKNVAGEPAAEVVQLKAGGADAADIEVSDVYVPRPSIFDELSRRAADAKRERGGGIVMLGDVGTGKSTTLKHFANDMKDAGWETFLVRHRDSQNRQSLSVVRSWIRQIALTYKEPATLIRRACESIGLEQGIDAVVALYLSANGADARLAGQLPWQDAKAYAFFTTALLQRMVRFAMKKGPVLLAVDDLDRRDAAEIDVMESLLQTVQKHSVLVIATMRHQSTERDHGLPALFEVLPIGSFSENEARQFISMSLGYTPPADVVAHLTSRSGGNPMFLTEMVRTITRDDQTRMLTASALEKAIPQSLQEILASRIDEVGDSVRDVLAIASVLGESFREQFLYQIAPAHLGPQFAVAELVKKRLLDAALDPMGNVTLAFNPRALRQIVYDRLPRESRAQFHRGVIEFLEQAGDMAAIDPLEWPLMLAFHYRNVEGWEGAAHYLMRAGDVLLDLYDYAGAILQYEEGMGLLTQHGFPKDNPTYLALIARLLVALRESGRLDAAYDLIGSLPNLDSVGEDFVAPLLLEQGRVGMEAGDVDKAYQALDRVRDIALQRQDLKLEIQALLAIGQIFEKQNQLTNAANTMMEVSRKVEGIQINMADPEDRKLYWTAYNQLGTLFIRQRDFNRAQHFLNQALRRAQEIQDQRGLIRVLSNLGALCLSMRDTSGAREYFANALQFARGSGDLLSQARIQINLGIALMEVSDFEGAKKYFKQARDVAEDIGWHEGLADLSLHIQRLRSAMGI